MKLVKLTSEVEIRNTPKTKESVNLQNHEVPFIVWNNPKEFWKYVGYVVIKS